MKPKLLHSIAATVVLCCAVVGYTGRMPDFGRWLEGANDFLPHYTHARMAFQANQFDVQAAYDEQDRAAGLHIADAMHDRFPWQAMVMWPLAQLPYATSRWVWFLLELAAFAGLVWIWLLPRDAVLWGATFFPIAACIVSGQDTLFLVLAFAAAIRCALAGKDIAAGLLLALCTAKPHLFVLVPIALIAARRWSIVWSALAGTVTLLLAGTVAAGPQWPLRWWAVVTALRSAQVAVRPSVFQLGMTPWVVALALILALLFAIAIRKAPTLEVGMALAVIGGILIAPHTAAYDLPLLLVAITALPLEGWRRWMAYGLLSPLPYWALLSGAAWVLPVMLVAFSAMAVLSKERPAVQAMASAAAA